MPVSRELNLKVIDGDLKLHSVALVRITVGFPTIALRAGKAGTDEGSVPSEPLS